MNYLFLEVGGNFNDILHMNYWRFRSIMATLHKKNCIQNGKPYVETGLSQSSRDMIAKRKAQR